MKIISEHKKRNGRKISVDYHYTPPANGMKRVMAIINGKTRHVDIPA